MMSFAQSQSSCKYLPLEAETRLNRCFLVENTCLQKSGANLQAELDGVREVNKQLQEEKEAAETVDGERHEMETLLEEQRQLYEDIQAKLGKAAERVAPPWKIGAAAAWTTGRLTILFIT